MLKKLNHSLIYEALSSRPLTAQHKSLADFPHFSLLKDMQKATTRIAAAIKNKERICVLGDFDADGIVATATLVEFFNDIGYPINYKIPDRFLDGYGLSSSLLEGVEANLLISVDTGITCPQEVIQICKNKNMDLIVTDHHTVGDKIPECYAVVNPKRKDCLYDFKNICGAQISFLLCCSIKHALGIEMNMSKYIDILAIAVVADIN